MKSNYIPIDEIPHLIASHFSSIGPVNVVPGPQPNIYYLEASDVQLVLKQHNDRTLDDRKELGKIYQHCSEKNIIPEMIPSNDNNYIISFNTYTISIQKRFLANTCKHEPGPEALGKKVSTLHKILEHANCGRLKNHFQRRVDDMPSQAVRFGYSSLLPIVEKVIHAKSKEFSTGLIHGDMHRENIIVHDGNIFFLDLDSINYFHRISDLAFSAYRVYGFNQNKISKYLKSYNENMIGSDIQYREIWDFVIYNILQRILFIQLENERGIRLWLTDLKNQLDYLDQVIAYKKNLHN